MKRQPISTGSEWTFDLIRQYDREIGRIAERYALDTYPNQIEVITAEQMMDAYASVGMPLGYHHWSYGKQFLHTEKHYKRGQMGLAYEIVINSDPCIAYLMEENTMCMQALVIAHASYGHNSFFKGNYLFRTWTDASSIIDYLVFAKQYIMQCEERHGIDAVEDLLDSCHALMNYGVDRYKRPYPISAEEERRRQKDREEHLQRQINDLWRTIPKGADKGDGQAGNQRFPAEPQENILYFIEACAAAGTLAAGDRAHRAQDRAVLLPAAPDPGDERGLGHLLALHPAQRSVRRRPGHRRLHDGVSAVAHQRHLPARIRQPLLQRHEPLHPRLRHVPGHPPDLREPDRRGQALVPGHRRQRLADHGEIRHEQLQGRASSCNSSRPR